MLLEADEFRARLVEEISASHLHEGLETPKLFVALLQACAGGEKPDLNPLAESLEEKIAACSSKLPSAARWKPLGRRPKIASASCA